MRCYRFADLIVSIDADLPELPAAPPGRAADVVVTHASGPPPSPVRWFQTWSAGGDAVRFGRTDRTYVVTFEDVADALVTPEADRVAIHPRPGASDFMLRHVLLHQVLPLVMSRQGRCVLHASAVSWRDRVVGFVGRTGSGKSTLAAACAWLGAGLVTDDSLVLDHTGDRWVAIASYPGLRLRARSLALMGRTADPGRPPRPDDKILLTAGRELPALESRRLPLDRLYLASVVDAGGGLERLRGSAAAIALASQLFRLDVEDAVESRRLFDAVTSLARTTPVWAVRVRRGGDVRAAAKSILDGQEQFGA